LIEKKKKSLITKANMKSKVIQKKYLNENYFYSLLDTALIVIEDLFKQTKSHKRIWEFLYKLDKLLEKTELLTYCTDLHLTLSRGQQLDLSGVDLANN